jgi:hypothetical protein
MWSRFCGQVSVEVFVPKGLDEGSLAVYCLECVLKKIRPVGYGMSALLARSVLKVGLASEARSTRRTSAKAEGRGRLVLYRVLPASPVP